MLSLQFILCVWLFGQQYFLNFGRENRVKLCTSLICMLLKNKEGGYHNIKVNLLLMMLLTSLKLETQEMSNGNILNPILHQFFWQSYLLVENNLVIIILNKLMKEINFMILYGHPYQQFLFLLQMKFLIFLLKIL